MRNPGPSAVKPRSNAAAASPGRNPSEFASLKSLDSASRFRSTGHVRKLSAATTSSRGTRPSRLGAACNATDAATFPAEITRESAWSSAPSSRMIKSGRSMSKDGGRPALSVSARQNSTGIDRNCSRGMPESASSIAIAAIRASLAIPPSGASSATLWPRIHSPAAFRKRVSAAAETRARMAAQAESDERPTEQISPVLRTTGPRSDMDGSICRGAGRSVRKRCVMQLA